MLNPKIGDYVVVRLSTPGLEKSGGLGKVMNICSLPDDITWTVKFLNDGETMNVYMDELYEPSVLELLALHT